MCISQFCFCALYRVIPKALLPHEVLISHSSSLCFHFLIINFHIKIETKSTPLLQISGETIGEVKAVADMHQRKAEMAKHADPFIALPGN